MKKKFTFALALILSIQMILSACGATNPSSSEDPPGEISNSNLEVINIAFELPLTAGAGGWDGALMRAGIDIGMEMYADDFAELGIAINPILNDHEGSADTASVNIVKDIEMYQCPLVFGTYTGPLSTMASVCEENKVLLINTRAPGDSLVGLNDWLYNTYPCDNLLCETMADYLYNEEGYRKIASLGDSGAISKSQHNSFVAAWEKLGGEIVCDLEVAADAADYLSYCKQVIQSGAEAVLLANADDSLSVRQMTQFLQLGASEMGYISLGTGDTAFGKDFSNPCYTSMVRVSATEEVKNAYLTKYKYKDYDYEAASTYTGVFVNAFMMMDQLFTYCRENNLDITGENLKGAMDALGTFEIMSGTMTLIEGNTVQSPIDIYKGIGSDVQIAASYYDD